MLENDSLAERGRALEEEYFRKKDRELIEKMRQAAAVEDARQELGRSAGLSDPALVAELEQLGFRPDTLSLLPLMPVLQMAWAEGGVTRTERDLLVSLARRRGISEGSTADRQLVEWMTHRPADDTFERANRLIAAILHSGSGAGASLDPQDLVRQCEQIAAASGGLLGIGKVSSEERELLTRLSQTLSGRQA